MFLSRIGFRLSFKFNGWVWGDNLNSHWSGSLNNIFGAPDASVKNVGYPRYQDEKAMGAKTVHLAHRVV